MAKRTIQDPFGYQVFSVCNYLFMGILSVLCILPLLHVLAISLSSAVAAGAGDVKLWPVEFTLRAYSYALSNQQFWLSVLTSVKRIFLGGSISMLLTILVAYPLSKEPKVFPARMVFSWFFLITLLFNGGLIPTYLAVRWTGLIDSIWALVIPGAVSVWNTILLMNFFRQLPKEMDEAAFIDGAGHWTVLWRIYLPTSTPAIATITLFTLVFHWNSWFDAMIYLNHPKSYPLQAYLQTLVIQHDFKMMNKDDWKLIQELSQKTLTAAQIFIGAFPILAVYPFLQKYFTKGIVLGSVKG